ncbi:acetoin utilization AcuB family protein [Bhargavaea beijingensis]|uniref:Acetoin utilization protein AcuB n=1 Tax=Bhargavaea beijingensis TaxID=426756 RepID=A0A1G7EJZ0_9BACL|nr:acetoin utilization AcuB family protein [Bhargavaea beijingensis]MCW1928545.1 acetoin utilization AcuB family protein [Bhargavaea beijingensis]RSK25348.1 CBS domain-containing protein [Bhargavaea beijingensis]SDE63982.1 acetoin utilization protein AcuB [Bhargavaea beijingensis]
MILEEIMNTEVVTLGPGHTIREARERMEDKKIRHLPIVDDQGEIIGIVSDRDLKEAIPSSLIGKQDLSVYDTPLSEIMTQDPLVGHPLDFVEEAAVIFYEHGIGCLPVVTAGKVVGIITETDLLYRYIELTGASKPGSQIEVRVPDVAGVLFGVSKVFYDHNANVLSVLVYPDKERLDHKILVIRVKTMNPLEIIEELRKEGYDVLWPNLPGMQQ